MVCVDGGDFRALNQLGLVHLQLADPLWRHAHVLSQQPGSDGGAEDEARGKTLRQACGVIRVEVGQQVGLAGAVLEAEAVYHQPGACRDRQM